MKEKQSMPVLSVIVVSYNEAEYLRAAIDSCLSQEFKYPYEIIIGDDGSDDGSIDIIKEYQKKHPDIVSYFVMDRSDVVSDRIIPSIRVSNVMKKAMVISRGKYLCVLSGDDIFADREMWERDVDYLEKHRGYVACYSKFKYFWDSGKEEAYPCPKYNGRGFFWGFSYVHISCMVFRRECLNNLLTRFCDDCGLCYSIVKSGRVKYIPGVVLGYRQREGSIMHEGDSLISPLTELLLYQDILNNGGFDFFSHIKFLYSMHVVWDNRKIARDQRYKKYIDNATCFSHDIISWLTDDTNDNVIKRLTIRIFFKVSDTIYCIFKRIAAIIAR